MSTYSIITLIYGLLMLAGGYMGYIKAGSKVSLISGAVSGILILIGWYLLKSNPKAAQILLVSVSGLLSVAFLVRLMKTHNFMPSGMLLVLSVVYLIISVVQITKKV